MARLLRGSATVAGEVSQTELDAFVGTTNITTLGTVATGNLSNTDIVYPTGHVLQVVSTCMPDIITSTASGGGFDYFMSLAINPNSTSNKVLVLAAITGGTQTHSVYYKFQHNGSGSYADVDGAIGSSTSIGSRIRITGYGVGGTSDNAEMQTTILCYLDSPSKDSSFTYRVGGSVRAAGTTWTINRPYDDTDATYTGRGVSTLTLMEVKG